MSSKILQSLFLTLLKLHRRLLPTFIEEIGMYSDSRTIYMNILCGKNAELILAWTFTERPKRFQLRGPSLIVYF